MKEKNYHHGDLRNSLIQKGLVALEEEGIENLSIRSMAKSLGVSKTAPYRHFSTKQDFLGALSNEGFRLLFERLNPLLSKEKSGLTLMGREYFSFAKDRPTLYRLMFSSLMCQLSDEDSFWARKSLGMLCLHITGKSLPEEATTSQLVSVWAYLHGVTSLYLDQIYPENFPEPDWESLVENIPLN